MYGLFYKNTEKRFSFAEYETEKEAKSEKKRLKKQTHFKFQVRKIKSDFVLEHPEGGYVCDKNIIGFANTLGNAKIFESKQDAGDFAFFTPEIRESGADFLWIVNLRENTKEKYFFSKCKEFCHFALQNIEGKYLRNDFNGIHFVPTLRHAERFKDLQDAEALLADYDILDDLTLLNLETGETIKILSF